MLIYIVFLLGIKAAVFPLESSVGFLLIHARQSVFQKIRIDLVCDTNNIVIEDIEYPIRLGGLSRSERRIPYSQITDPLIKDQIRTTCIPDEQYFDITDRLVMLIPPRNFLTHGFVVYKRHADIGDASHLVSFESKLSDLRLFRDKKSIYIQLYISAAEWTYFDHMRLTRCISIQQVLLGRF